MAFDSKSRMKYTLGGRFNQRSSPLKIVPSLLLIRTLIILMQTQRPEIQQLRLHIPFRPCPRRYLVPHLPQRFCVAHESRGLLSLETIARDTNVFRLQRTVLRSNEQAPGLRS